jgi:hypothetical protein
MPLLSIKMSAIVYTILRNINKISAFEIIPPEDIVEQMMFDGGYTETTPFNEGWVLMDI